MLGFMIVGASSGPPDSMTSTCAPDADNSAARTEPAAPTPTTMKSYRFSLFDALVIFNPGHLKSDFSHNRLERSTSCELLPTSLRYLTASSALLPPFSNEWVIPYLESLCCGRDIRQTVKPSRIGHPE